MIRAVPLPEPMGVWDCAKTYTVPGVRAVALLVEEPYDFSVDPTVMAIGSNGLTYRVRPGQFALTRVHEGR